MTTPARGAPKVLRTDSGVCMGDTRTQLPHLVRDVVCHEVARASAATVVSRLVDHVLVLGGPLVLATTDHRLGIGAASRAPGWDHPAARVVATLHGHAVDRRRRLLAPVRIVCGVDRDGLVLSGATVRDDAVPTLRAGIELVRRELVAWDAAARAAAAG